jgi:DNA-binding transcriptional ArsR family regulator
MEIDRRSAEVWAGWFRCLADPSRVLLLNRLAAARRSMTVGELVEALDIGQPTVSHHLKVLAEVGFVHGEARANTTQWSVNERCLERFPSAAELIMGVLPRYERHDSDCLAPWQHDDADDADVTSDSATRRPRKAPADA